MKKIALTLIICALAAPAFAWNGYQDTQDYAPGFHGVFDPIFGGAAWTNNFGAWAEAESLSSTAWLGTNAGSYLDEGAGIDWHGVYVGSSGDYNHWEFQFVAPEAITLQDFALKVLVQRGTSTSRYRDADMYVSVNGGTMTKVFDMGDETGDTYGAGKITTDPLWGSAFVMDGAENMYTADLTAMNIQKDDVVTYRWKMQQNSPAGSNSKQMGLAISLQDVPEPATMSLLGVGALALIRRKK